MNLPLPPPGQPDAAPDFAGEERRRFFPKLRASLPGLGRDFQVKESVYGFPESMPASPWRTAGRVVGYAIVILAFVVWSCFRG